MEKNKYYIIRDFEDLDWFFKLGIVNFSSSSQIEYKYDIFKECIDDGRIIVIYSKDGNYIGYDFYEYISYKNYQAIEFKVYLRKKKLEILGGL